MTKLGTNVFAGSYKLLDSRLTQSRYANYAYAAPRANTRREWDAHKRLVRRRVLLAAGLAPLPKKTPLKARVFGRAELDGCTVEKVHFESRPGFLVTGNLYRPVGAEKKYPAILCPHGHWPHGRMEDSDLSSVPGRCMMLARLGFVAFSYDMIGYNDSCQVEHRWPDATLRKTLLYGMGPCGLQLWNSIRAVDFVTRLRDVDAKRIGCTGASGGATQTYYLAAVDDRIRVVVPVCMMSAHYQGGCTCEEPPLLHLDDLTTLDVVGSLAPRPVLLPSVTRDWTNQNPRYDVPAIRRIYELYGAADRVGNVHFDAPHNYNKDIREHMYAWFRRWLARDRKVGARIREPELDTPPASELRLFPGRTAPAGLKRDTALLDHFVEREQRPFDSPPKSNAGVRRLRAVWKPVYEEVLGCREPVQPVSIGTYRELGESPQFVVSGRALGRYGRAEQTPGLWIVPKIAGRRSAAALVLCENGKRELFVKGRPVPVITALIHAGVSVLAIDMLGKGETRPILKYERLDRSDPIFYSFNRSLTAHRVQEILTALAALRQHDGVRQPSLIGFGVGGVAALLARPLAGKLRSSVIDLTGCNVAHDRFWMGEMYHPFIRKLGDVRGALALGSTSPLMLGGAGPALSQWAKATYRLTGRGSSLRASSRKLSVKSIVKWLC